MYLEVQVYLKVLKNALKSLSTLRYESVDPSEWTDQALKEFDKSISDLHKLIEQFEMNGVKDTSKEDKHKVHTDHPMRHFDRTCPACQTEEE